MFFFDVGDPDHDEQFHNLP